MNKNKIEGAKKGVQNMLFYLISSLIDEGISDPKQYIATEIARMITLSEEQLCYVRMNLNNENKILKSFHYCIDLLEKMKNIGKLDSESIGLVIQMLQIMQEDCKSTLESLKLIDDEDKSEDKNG